MKRLKSKAIGKSGRRRSSGYALVAVLTVSVFATMLLLTLAGITVSLSRSEVFYKQRELALVGADVGLDFTRKSLNKSLLTGTPSPLEPAVGESERISELPATLVPQGNDKCKVFMRVRRMTPQEILTASQKASPAVSYQWNPNNKENVADWKYGHDWRNYSAPELSYYWMVEVTSYRGMFAVSTRAMLAPDIDAPVYDPSISTPTRDSFFVEGIVADKEVNLAPAVGYLDVLAPGEGFSSAQVDGSVHDTNFKTVVQSNNLATATGVTNVYGDLRVTNPLGASDSVARGLANGDGNSPLVWGRVQTNSVPNSSGVEGSMSGFTGTPGNLPSGSDNVLGLSDYFFDFDGFWTTGMREGVNETNPLAALPSETANQVSPNPVPYGTDGSPLPAFPQPPPPDSGAPMPGDTIVDPGVYRTSSMDSSAAVAKLVFNNSGGPTTIFIDANADGSPVNIDSQWLQNNGSAKDLQIYYAGDKDLKLTMNGDLAGATEMKALIYAPNAKVTTEGFGEFQGAILSKTLQVNHTGDFRVDPDASRVMIDRTGQNGGGGGGGSAAFAGERLPTRYRVASWQQVSGSLVPAVR